MKQMTTALTILFLTFFAATAIAQTAIPEEVKYPVKIGTVTFNHVQHKTLNDCITCHHTGENKSCHDCHGVTPDIADAKTVFHTQCKNCHKEQKKGPLKCKECHIK